MIFTIHAKVCNVNFYLLIRQGRIIQHILIKPHAHLLKSLSACNIPVLLQVLGIWQQVKLSPCSFGADRQVGKGRRKTCAYTIWQVVIRTLKEMRTGW